MPGKSISMPPLASNWENSGTPFNCGEWTPLPIEIKEGLSFTQSQSCQQQQTRTVTYREKDEFTGKILILEVTEESQVVSVPQEQLATGLDRGESCSDALSLGFTGSGTHKFNNGSTAYCEQDLLGGGYRRIVSNIYHNGDLAGGADSNNQKSSESNPTNTIVFMKNPTGSNYVIHQTGNVYHEYQMTLSGSQLSSHTSGRYMSFSLWTLNPDRWMTHNRMYFADHNPMADSGSYKIVEKKNIDGKTWHRVKYLAKIPYPNMNIHNWYVGYRSGGDSYFTGMTHEVYVKD
ncbi:hypothetical protein [Vibrio harveyi]|uniref:hypothetical protein n=1 Tax=Vibrio harveyi TaxID=669 RepID=UPI003CF16D74